MAKRDYEKDKQNPKTSKQIEAEIALLLKQKAEAEAREKEQAEVEKKRAAEEAAKKAAEEAAKKPKTAAEYRREAERLEAEKLKMIAEAEEIEKAEAEEAEKLQKAIDGTKFTGAATWYRFTDEAGVEHIVPRYSAAVQGATGPNEPTAVYVWVKSGELDRPLLGSEIAKYFKK